MKIIPTILCGGSGTRLWPTSRTYAPKQLQSLVGEKSLLANTVLRLQAQENCISPVLICGQSYATEIEHQMEDEGAELSAVIAEPMGRDTAAAAAIAAHWARKIQQENPDEQYVVLLLPADHHISDIPGFHQALDSAGEAALAGYISTIGIRGISYPRIASRCKHSKRLDFEEYLEIHKQNTLKRVCLY